MSSPSRTVPPRGAGLVVRVNEAGDSPTAPRANVQAEPVVVNQTSVGTPVTMSHGVIAM